MQTLTKDTDAFKHLLAACQKVRALAAENGYLDLLAPNKDLGLPGLDPIVGDDRTVVLLAELALGERTCDDQLWANLSVLVDRSPTWGMELAMRGVQMPDRTTTWNLPQAS